MSDEKTDDQIPPTEAEASEITAEKVVEAKFLLNTMMYYRKLCDDKASILLAIFGAVVTAIIMIGGQQIAELLTELTKDSDLLGYLLVALIIFSMFMLATGVFLLICTVNPYTGTETDDDKEKSRIKRITRKIKKALKKFADKIRNKGKEDEEPSSILYFRGIVKYKCKEFRERFKGYDNEDYVNDILEEVHITATVCVKKYWQLQWGLSLSAAGIAAFAASVMIGFMFV